MDILILLAVVVVLVALAVYAVQNLPALRQPWAGILIALICLIAIIVVCQKAGLLSH